MTSKVELSKELIRQHCFDQLTELCQQYMRCQRIMLNNNIKKAYLLRLRNGMITVLPACTNGPDYEEITAEDLELRIKNLKKQIEHYQKK